MTPMAERLGTIAGIWRYPVKSLGGEALDQVELTADGLPGDRGWAVYTEANRPASGKPTRRFDKVPGLLHLAAELDGGSEPVIVLPDGQRIRAGGAAGALSAAIGMPLDARPEGEVPHKDAAPVHLVTSATLAALSSATSAPVEADRFRPNLLLDTEADGFAEDGWLGHRVAIGGAVLRVTDRTERCVMTNHSRPGLPERRDVLRTAGRVNDACAGVYLDVETAGVVTVGDRAELLAD